MSQNANLTSPNLLKHPADFANLFRSVLSPLILSLPIYFGGEGGQALIVGFTVWFLLSDMNFLLHQHVHLPLTTSTYVNRLIDLTLGIVTGMSAASWRIHHVDRHHAADDSWSQLFEWESSQFSYLAYVTYSLRYGVAMLVLPLIESARNAMSSKRVNDCVALAEQTLILGLIMLLITVRPSFFLPYYILVYFFTAAADYENHVGCDDSPFGFSNNTIDPVYNWVRNNFGYHTAHHYHPHSHWTELPDLHEDIEDKIPTERITSKWWTGFATPPLIAYLAFTYLTRFGYSQKN